jgi:hypothetical protein
MIKNKKYNHSEILENYSFEIQLNLVLANMKEAVHEPRKAELRVISTDDNQYLKKTRHCCQECDSLRTQKTTYPSF